MKTTTIKKTLLLGTSLVVVGAFASHANAAELTLTGDAVWGTAANGMVATPTTADSVVMTTHALKFDTTETGVTTSGALTSTTGNLTIDTTGDNGNVAFTIGSFAGTGASVITVDNLDASTTRNVAATFTGGVSTGTGGNLVVQNTEVGASGSTVAMTVGGNVAIGGTTAVTTTGTGQTGTTAALDLNGASNVFTGAVTVTGGANDATNDSTLSISGAATTFTGGLTLTDGAAGQAILNLDGLTTAQTVTGNIAGDGDINVQNAAGVTFGGTVTSGTVLIENGGAALNSSATFQNTVTSAVTLGAAGTGTNTATFDTTAQAFTVTGAVAGAIAGETNNVAITGDDVLTQATGWTANLDNIAVSGTATLDSNAALTATNLTVASGAKVDQGSGLITAAVANAGTIQFTGTGSITGAITGAGTLDVDAATTLTGAVAQTSADIAAVTLTLADGTDAYSVGTTNFSADGTLDIGNGSRTVTGNFTTTTDAQGTVSVQDGAGTTAIVGNLGTGTANSLKALTVAGGAGQTVTLTGNAYVDAITVNDADTFSLIGGGTQTVSGTITDGILTVGTSGTSAIYNGVISSAVSQDVGAGASATYNANATFTGGYTNNATGTTTVGVGSTLTAGSFTDTGSYVIQANDANGTLASADFGQIVDSSPTSTLTATNLSVDVTGAMTAGTVQLLTGIQAGAATLTDNSVQYSFTTANNGNNTDVTVAKATAASLATGTSNVGAATVLDTLSTSTDTQIAAVNDALAAASSSEAFNEIVESVAPTVDGGGVVAGFSASSQSLAVNNTRLASLRGDTTGMAAGDMTQGVKFWTQGFGKVANQDKRGGVDGFDSDTYGVAFGADTSGLADDAVVGVAVSYANTDVESDNANKTDTDVDSYQISLYGDYDLDDVTYVSGSVGYAMNSLDQTRNNVGGVAGQNAKADYDSQQFMVSAEVGREYPISGGATITPSAGLSYQHISIDSYTETGAGGLNLQVDSEDLNVLDLGVGAEVKWDLEQANGSRVVPSINVGYSYDLIGDNVESTNSFTGGGASFKAEGADVAESTFNVGAAVTLYNTNNWEFTGAYDYEYKSDYDAHSGFVRAGYKF